MRIKVEVTEEHIRKGKRRKPNGCPVTRALRAAGFKRPFVADDYWEASNHWEDDLPLKVQLFIERFDAGKPVKPFFFTVLQ